MFAAFTSQFNFVELMGIGLTVYKLMDESYATALVMFLVTIVLSISGRTLIGE